MKKAMNSSQKKKDCGDARSFRKAQRIETNNRKAYLAELKEERASRLPDEEIKKTFVDFSLVLNPAEPVDVSTVLRTFEKEAAPAASETAVRKTHTTIDVYRYVEGKKILKTLEELKADFLNVWANDHVIYQKDVMAALDHIDMADDDMEALWNWFADQGIPVSEDEDINSIDELLGDEEAEEAEEEEESDDEEDEEDNDYEQEETSDLNFYHASSSPSSIIVHDMNGNYAHYTVDDFGNVSGYDSNGNYYHSHTDDFGNTSGYDSNGNYYHSRTDDFGNTSGYDSNGERYQYCGH